MSKSLEHRKNAIDELSNLNHFYVEIAPKRAKMINVTGGEFWLSFFKYFCPQITQDALTEHAKHLVPILYGNPKIEVTNRAAIHVKFANDVDFDHFSRAICEIINPVTTPSRGKTKKVGGKSRRRRATRRHA